LFLACPIPPFHIELKPFKLHTNRIAAFSVQELNLLALFPVLYGTLSGSLILLL
jgi:hypothetical protein